MNAIFEFPPHPHPAAQNDAERVIDVIGEQAIVVVHAQDSNGHTAQRLGQTLVRAANAHDELVAALEACAKLLRYGGYSLDERNAAVNAAADALAVARQSAYQVKWGNGYHGCSDASPRIEERALDFFNEDNGYTSEDRLAIAHLQVGWAWQDGDSTHVVTRIR